MAGRGAPLGNRNGAKNKVWSDAIRRAIARKDAGEPQRLNRLADALLRKCEDGDVSALKEFGDRIEGKVPQAIEGTGENGELEVSLTVTYVDKK